MALELQRFGWDASALEGGIAAWKDSYPVEAPVELLPPRFIEPGSRLS
ncbi:MAG: hypothetical protein HOC77_02710 [Chloroflexi bacterium]|nr:hypothetical protein [Chloroflexota bacterium]MBT4072629.1 hypothetical protein [Chloroflexota bacterium]MBT4513988.1 hypothetical protein [Chloroflexota bacterium]MBT5320720.1 hypothetical protein [Chloroflexota bacterium]MBT6681815.1 hypothetical protein [Chloroflexota bacterium]